MVIRMIHPLQPGEIEILNEEFASLVAAGPITQGGPLEGETDHPELPRLTFQHTRQHFGRIRQLIDRINSFGPPPALERPPIGGAVAAAPVIVADDGR
jgi:hypothetical protein